MKERVVGIMLLTQFVPRVSKTSMNDEEEVIEKDDEVNSAGPSVEANLLVNKKITLEDGCAFSPA